MSKIVSIIVGLALVVVIALTTFVNKKPVFIPPTDSSTSSSTGSTGSNNPPPTTSHDGEDENESDDDNSGPVQIPSPGVQTGGSSGITLATISQHNSRTSCWTAINGNVYDLTSWIPNHPGGEQPILSLCGHDGSLAFNAQHGGQQKQAMILAGFKIGTLAQ